MKTLKARILTLLWVAVLTVSLSLSLASCNMLSSVDDEGEVTVVVESAGNETVYTVALEEIENKDNGALGALDALVSAGLIEYEINSAGFLTKVGALEQNPSEGIYIGIWTSVTRDFDVSVYATEKDYENMTLVSSGFGIKDMSLEDGCVIYIGELIYKQYE